MLERNDPKRRARTCTSARWRSSTHDLRPTTSHEAGHTLAESAVAVALLLTVLVPAAMFLVFLTTQ
ncbi:MAG: hypothetical protein AAFU38_21355, partial [Bacteroidota bacterium]